MKTLNRKQTLQQFIAFPADKQAPFHQAWKYMKCYVALIWGVGDSLEINYSSDEKQHFLLMYKYLVLIWLDYFPYTASEVIEIFLANGMPETLTPKNALMTYEMDDCKLRPYSMKRPRPSWTYWISIVKMQVSIDSFPLETPR